MTNVGPKHPAPQDGPEKKDPSRPTWPLRVPMKTVTPPTPKPTAEPKATGPAGVKNYDAAEHGEEWRNALAAAPGWYHENVDGNVTAWRFDRPDGLFVLLSDSGPSAPSLNPMPNASGEPIYLAGLYRPGGDDEMDAQMGFISGNEPYELALRVQALPVAAWGRPKDRSLLTLDHFKVMAKSIHGDLIHGRRNDAAARIIEFPGPEGLALAALVGAEAQRYAEERKGDLLIHPLSDLETLLGRRSLRGNGEAPWAYAPEGQAIAMMVMSGKADDAWEQIVAIQGEGRIDGAAALVAAMRDLRDFGGLEKVMAFVAYACNRAGLEATVAAVSAAVPDPVDPHAMATAITQEILPEVGRWMNFGDQGDFATYGGRQLRRNEDGTVEVADLEWTENRGGLPQAWLTTGQLCTDEMMTREGELLPQVREATRATLGYYPSDFLDGMNPDERKAAVMAFLMDSKPMRDPESKVFGENYQGFVKAHPLNGASRIQDVRECWLSEPPRWDKIDTTGEFNFERFILGQVTDECAALGLAGVHSRETTEIMEWSLQSDFEQKHAPLVAAFKGFVERSVKTLESHAKGNTTQAVVNQEFQIVINAMVSAVNGLPGPRDRTETLEDIFSGDGFFFLPSAARRNGALHGRLLEELLPHVHAEEPGMAVGDLAREVEALRADQEDFREWWTRLGGDSMKLRAKTVEKGHPELFLAAKQMYRDGSYGEALPSADARRGLMAFVRSDSEPVMPLRLVGSGYHYATLTSAVEAIRNNLTGVPFQTGTLELRDLRQVAFANLKDPDGNILRGAYAYRIANQPNQPWHAV